MTIKIRTRMAMRLVITATMAAIMVLVGVAGPAGPREAAQAQVGQVQPVDRLTVSAGGPYNARAGQPVIFRATVRAPPPLVPPPPPLSPAPPQPPVVTPPPRSFAAMAYHPPLGRVVLFGGVNCDGETCTDLADTWTWDGVTWRHEAPSGSPTPRSFPAMVYDGARNATLLFGGAANGDDPLGDTWAWNGSTWTQITPMTNPAPRYGAAIAFNAVQGAPFLFSGTDGEADTWGWDGNSWTRR